MRLLKFSRACEEDEQEQIRRLHLLENAILNYGGGLANLKRRAKFQAKKLQGINPEASEVLYDVACYLRDVESTGKLDTRDFNTWLREYKFND